MNFNLNTKHFSTIAIEKLYHSKKPKHKTVTYHNIYLFSTKVLLLSPYKSKKEPGSFNKSLPKPTNMDPYSSIIEYLD